MPYKMQKNEKGEYCVHNSQTNENKGCSKSKKMGLAHMRALYAAEGGAKMGKKELADLDELITKAEKEFLEQYPDDTGECITCGDDGTDGTDLQKDYYEQATPYMPLYGATSFEELDAIRDTQEESMQLSELTSQFNVLVGNIMSDESIEDRVAAVETLTKEFTDRIDSVASGNISDDEKEYDEDETGLETKAKWDTAKKNDLPDSAFLYIKPNCGKKEGGITIPKSCRKFPYKNSGGKIDLPHLRNAIARIPQANGISPEEKKSLQARARKLLASANKESFMDNVKETVLSVMGSLGLAHKESEPPYPELMVWKEADGQYRWIACYSNKFMDVEGEILCEVSHKTFVDKVDKGLAALPELWLWHVPEWKIGVTDWITYDDSGFTVAGGRGDKGKEEVFDWLSQQSDFAVSHGMPRSKIVYSADDPGVILDYETREISPLPREKAANKLTGFVVLKEDHMPIPEDKKKTLINKWHIDSQLLAKIEQANAETAVKATNAGIESKEKKEPTVQPVQIETPVPEPVKTEAPVTPPAEKKIDVPVETKDEKPSPAVSDGHEDFPTRVEIAEAFGTVLAELKTQMNQISDRFMELSKELAVVKEADSVKVAKIASETPTASLAALIQASSAVKSAETVVPKDDKLAKSKPKAPSKTKDAGLFELHTTPIPFLNRMISGQPENAPEEGVEQ